MRPTQRGLADSRRLAHRTGVSIGLHADPVSVAAFVQDTGHLVDHGHIFGQPVGHDASSRVTGALTGLTNLTQPNFLRIITDNAYGKTDGFLLVDPVARRVIVATDQARILEQLPPPGVNPALDRFLAGYEGSQIMVAYFSDRGRLFQRDRGRCFRLIVDAQRCAQASG